MNGKDLLLGMNFIDVAYVEEAESGYLAKKRHSFVRQLSIASGFVLILAAAISGIPNFTKSSHPLPPDDHPISVSESSGGQNERQSAIHLRMGDIFVNGIEGLSDTAEKRIYDPDLYDKAVWNENDIKAYYGRDLTPAYIPEGLTAAPNNGQTTVFTGKDGGIVFDEVSLNYYHAYYEDGSPKLTDPVTATKGFTLTASRLGIPNECIYLSPENEGKSSDIGGVPVTIGHQSMSYGPYDPQTHDPSGYYDFYLAEFKSDGVQYLITAEQLELQELVQIVASIVYNEEKFIVEP